MLKNLFAAKKRVPEDLLGDAALVMQASLKVDFDFEGYASRHIFNRVSATSEYGFYYYPYGYLFRYPRWGTVNEMGFRCPVEIPKVRETWPDHLVVAVFGGSTGFDILVPDEATFAARLEQFLNADAELLARTGRSFKVVNLSQPGNMTLNQIVNYIVFCHRLRPDIVVSHNGANDIATAQMNDRNLIANYDLGYADVLETWGRMLHRNPGVPLDYDHARPEDPQFRPAQVRTRPEEVIRSYHARVLQFRELAAAQGAHFISGFQPWITSKRNLSPFERERLSSYNPYYQTVYANAPELYERYDRLLETEDHAWVVNLHRRFRDLDPDTDHFGDVCHLLEPGDKVVGQAYARKIRALYMETPP